MSAMGMNGSVTSSRSASCPVIIEEKKAKKAKYRKFRTVIDLTDEFNTTEYVEEVFSVV